MSASLPFPLSLYALPILVISLVPAFNRSDRSTGAVLISASHQLKQLDTAPINYSFAVDPRQRIIRSSFVREHDDLEEKVGAD